jgi:hypothetical protein
MAEQIDCPKRFDVPRVPMETEEVESFPKSLMRYGSDVAVTSDLTEVKSGCAEPKSVQKCSCS